MSFAHVNGTSIFYTMQGQGTPIVFIHPPTLTSRVFSHQVAGLSKLFQTIVFDIRGHGRSAPSEQVLTYGVIADDIKALLDLLGLEKAFLCGYSTGGEVILEFLLSYPERAQGAVLIGAMSEIHDLRLRLRIRLAMAMAKLRLVKPLALSITWSNSVSGQFRAAYHEAKRGNPRNIMEYYQSSLTYRCTDRLAQIGHPTLLVYGDKDTQFHSYARLLHGHLRHSKLIYLHNTDHRIPVNAGPVLNRIIEQFIHEDCGM